MRRSKTIMRILGGVILTAALAACSDSPLAPTDDLAFGLAGGGATFTDFTTTDVPTGVVDPGTAEVQGNLMAIRGVVLTSRLTASDPRGTGNVLATVNEQLSLADGSGRAWGKFEVAADVGGVWEGTLEGQREQTAPGLWVATLKLVGSGHGGAIEGLHFSAVEIQYSPAQFFGPFIGYGTGTILEPGN